MVIVVHFHVERDGDRYPPCNKDVLIYTLQIASIFRD